MIWLCLNTIVGGGQVTRGRGSLPVKGLEEPGSLLLSTTKHANEQYGLKLRWISMWVERPQKDSTENLS